MTLARRKPFIKRWFKINKGYTYLNDGVAVDNQTGEVVETVTVVFPLGSKTYTPQQQRAYKDHKLNEAKRRAMKYSNKELGSFNFVSVDNGFNDLKAATVARLIYLTTFSRQGSSILYKRTNTPIKYDDLPKLMNCSPKTIDRFWLEVSPKYIFLNEDKNIEINTTIIRRDKLFKQSGYWQRVYRNSVQKLFKTATNLNNIGYIFQMLEHVNIEYNLLCTNPEEAELSEIRTLSIDDFCSMINYDLSQKSRLINTLRKQTFNVNGKQERLISFVDGGEKIVINPRVLYSGSDFRKVAVLTLFYD